jgi:putative Mn2+ efflux pump MntP
MLLVGLVYALVFSHLLPVSTATTALVGGTLLAIPGLVMLIRFLRKYPLPAEAEAHGNG